MNRWRVLGVPIRLHPLFILIFLTAVVTGFFVEIMVLFVVVFIHEIGHAAAAIGFGWRVREIQLLPFGGVAVVDEFANIHPLQVIVVSIAGPLQHVWMATFAYLMMTAGWWSSYWALYFIHVNVMIGLFNLIPVHPLDGGKILQAMLSLFFSYYRTLSITAWIGFVSSIAILTRCLINSFQGSFPLNLFVIGLFLLFSNWYLWRDIPYHFIRFLMHRSSGDVFREEEKRPITPIVVAGKEKLYHVLQMFKQQHAHVIYVTGSFGEIQAIMPETKLIDAFFDKSKSTSAVSDLFM